MDSTEERMALTATKRAQARERTVEDWLGNFGGIGLVAAIATLGYQTYLWLKDGEWTSIPLYWAFDYFGIDYSPYVYVSWGGVQKILVWFVELPLSLVFIFLGVIAGYVTGHLVNHFSSGKYGS